MTGGVSKCFWSGRRVFLTGHTGFKGSWLALWLTQMGADVTGFALAPPTNPSLFEVTRLQERLEADIRGDIRSFPQLSDAMQSARPDIVFHLAAQPLVRYSYQAPVETYETNVMGTVHLLEAVRQTPTIRAVINITTDKCYENNEWVWPYRENDPMGGHDPYSNSKGCAELVTSAYRQSFLQEKNTQLASARAGNVIGGGDWAADRLIPDFLRAIMAGEELVIRSPHATRPWQHVLEPLAGYLNLAEANFISEDRYDEGWNFGPEESDAKPVRWIVEKLAELMPQARWRLGKNIQPHEANMLSLCSAKAKKRLQWKPRWNLATALSETVAWHEAWRSGDDMLAFSLSQIDKYQEAI